MTDTPSRKITNTKNRKKTGCFPSKKNERIVRFESLIERDYIHLLEFDKDVISYTEQPKPIKFTFNNRKYKYTPDFKVIRRIKTQIIEIKPYKKYKEILRDSNKRKKFDAAFNYCNYNDYEFKVITDEDIRTGNLLANVKYLFMYSTIKVPDNEKEYIANTLSLIMPISINELLNELKLDNSCKSQYQSYIFSLLYSRYLLTDLTQTISLKSYVWL